MMMWVWDGGRECECGSGAAMTGSPGLDLSRCPEGSLSGKCVSQVTVDFTHLSPTLFWGVESALCLSMLQPRSEVRWVVRPGLGGTLSSREAWGKLGAVSVPGALACWRVVGALKAAVMGGAVLLPARAAPGVAVGATVSVLPNRNGGSSQ